MRHKQKKRNKINFLLKLFVIDLFILPGLVRAVDDTIAINLEYKDGTQFDINNDGIESTKDVIDFTVENSVFSWNVDKSELCTRWETYSIDNEESTIVCYGSSECCSFINLQPTRANWNDIFYSYFGLYGATLNNVISAQVIYVDYNLSIDNPYADIYYSSWDNLSAIYEKTPETIEQETLKDLSNILDITISTPPPFIIKNSAFDIKVILTNFGKEILYDLPVNLILNSSLMSNESMQQIVSALGSGQSATLSWSITSTDSELEKYIMVNVGNKIEIKAI